MLNGYVPKINMVTVESLSEILKNIFEEDLAQKSGLFSVEQCKALLHEEEDIFPTMKQKEKRSYPCSPLYIEISKKLLCWLKTEQFPVNSKACGLLTEQDDVKSRNKRFQNVSSQLIKVETSWTDLTVEQKNVLLRSLLRLLGARGLLDLLNIRQTLGSVDVFPPPLKVLIMSFNKKHKPNSSLTVGARALSKHCHRDTTSGWWGSCTGSEQAKNEHADKIIMHILNDASWINIHLLLHDFIVLEVRCAEGYGARWNHDGKEFHGFLEPQMVDGHKVGWRH